MNISFLSSGHFPFDDRIFYHLGRSLAEAGHNVQIVSSKTDLKKVIENINIDCFAGDNLKKRDKILKFSGALDEFIPSVIICSEALPILAAKRFRKKHSGKSRIIYDITEWYPSGKNLTPFHPILRPLIFLKLLAFNIYATRYADAFIFGEWYKSRPYRFLFPKKPYIFLTYYPDLRYLKYKTPGITDGRLRLSFTGKISIEKGFGNFIGVIRELTLMKPGLTIEVKIIGWYETKTDKDECEKLIQSVTGKVTFSYSDRLPFITFWESVSNTDIFIDLRSDSFENNHSLPIRLFYFAALRRPVIFSDLKAIRSETDISYFGFLIKPDRAERIARKILVYVEDPRLYGEHCANAGRSAEDLYNWHKISPSYLKFIQEVSSL